MGLRLLALFELGGFTLILGDLILFQRHAALHSPGQWLCLGSMIDLEEYLILSSPWMTRDHSTHLLGIPIHTIHHVF